MHIEIFTKLSGVLIENMMKHEQLADAMDFLGFKGLKRWSEYNYFKDSAELRSIHRYSVNHFNKMIYDKNIPAPQIIPASWEGATRQQVDTSTRKKYLRQMMYDWHEWEVATREKYQTWYKQLIDEGHINAAYKVMDLIKCNEKEIKCLERKLIEYESVEWDMPYIMFQQAELHEKYKEKEKEIGIDIN